MLFILLSKGLVAQQDPILSNSINSPYLNNFALAGTTEAIQIDLISRLQWVGYNENPVTFLANGFVTLGKNKGQFATNKKQLFSNPEATLGVYKHVVGGNVYHDRIGLINRTSIKASYAIHLPISKKVTLSASLSAGYGNVGFNNKKIVVNTTTDILLNDLYSYNQNLFETSAGIGVYTKRLLFGFNVNQLMNSKTNFSNIDPRGSFNPQFLTNLSYDFEIGPVNIIPQAVYRFSNHTKGSLDFGFQVQYNRAIWLGLYARTSNAMIIQVGANLFKQAYLSYSFELPVAGLAKVTTTSHEIRLGIYLSKKKKNSSSTILEEVPITQSEEN